MKLRLREKIGYGFGDAASSMFWKLFSAYLTYFYTNIFGIAASSVGTMMLITRSWDSAFDPFVGVARRPHRTPAGANSVRIFFGSPFHLPSSACSRSPRRQ